MDRIYNSLKSIYNDEVAKVYSKEVRSKVEKTRSNISKKRKVNWDEKDIVLITYADQFYEKDIKTLKLFHKFAKTYFNDLFEMIHILPFCPYSSDDGFSVIDYKKVKEEFGAWEDVEEIGENFRLMFDYVCNHISAKSSWFKGYLEGEKEYEDFFLEVDPKEDLSLVVRPRAIPLLTTFDTAKGKKHIWTTFSEDQIDLNFSNPKVLIKMIEILLYYLEKGADCVRLDAVGFLWKEIGTTCIHHKKTHEIIQLFRDIIDNAAPGTLLITETNVPHRDNISYFGNGTNEAHMVYQFSLPPLVLYTFINQDSTAITNWAKELKLPSKNVTFFNFLASHDGIGLNPIRGIIEEEKILSMVSELEKECGALVSYKQNLDGTQSPYEINISYLSAMSYDADDEEIVVRKFLNAQAILLSLVGVPALYVHSVLGSTNYTEGVKVTGHNRTINREKLEYNKLVSEIEDTTSIRSKVYHQLCKIIDVRKSKSAFSPSSSQEILELSNKVFAVRRKDEKGNKVLCLNNISNEAVKVPVEIYENDKDLVTMQKLSNAGDNQLILNPYQFVWIEDK